MASPVLDDPTLAGLAGPLRRAKAVALGLLVVAGVVFVVMRIAARDSDAEWISYVEATAEAAMVGALADWFAVTALFRHPLGIPLPHTAIVARRKDQIGASLGNFVQFNFMAPDALADRVLSAEPSAAAARWLERPGSSARVAEQTCRAIGSVVELLDAEEMSEHLEHALTDAGRAINVGPVLADIASAILADGRRDQVVDGVFGVVVRLLESNRQTLRLGFAIRSPWWVPGSVDERVFEKLYSGIIDLLTEVRHTPTHELRRELDAHLGTLIERLRSDPTMAKQLESLRNEALQDERIRSWVTSLWADISRTIIAQANDPASRLFSSVTLIVERTTNTLRNDSALRDRLDTSLANLTRTLATEHGHEVARVISSTVERWDPKETSRRIELQIGRDLQFIRINGTLVGGAVGLLIHTIGQLIGR